jgi:hypothetical protein
LDTEQKKKKKKQQQQNVPLTAYGRTPMYSPLIFARIGRICTRFVCVFKGWTLPKVDDKGRKIGKRNRIVER